MFPANLFSREGLERLTMTGENPYSSSISLNNCCSFVFFQTFISDLVSSPVAGMSNSHIPWNPGKVTWVDICR